MRTVSDAADPFAVRNVRHAYDTVAEDYAARLPDTRAEAALDLAMVDALATAVAGPGGARVLDAGCGAGRISRYLADRGCVVLHRHLSTADDVAAGLAAVGLREVARLVRRPQGVETEDQAFVLARRDDVREG